MSSIKVQTNGGVLTITIDRPEARNAINLEVAESIASAIDSFEADNSLSVAVITGAGGTFCAGMDLKAFSRGERPSIPGRGFAGLTERPPTKPLIAAVEGWALAGGWELALTADLIVAASNAKFGLPEVKRGLVAAAGGLLRLPKTLPYHVAMQVALTGDPLSAEIAQQHGLVNIVCEPGDALAEATNLANSIAANAPLALQASKQIVSESIGYTVPEDFDAQRKIAERAISSADAKEGALAFAEKRTPVWTGK